LGWWYDFMVCASWMMCSCSRENSSSKVSYGCLMLGMLQQHAAWLG
jgi:hypothetical protein